MLAVSLEDTHVTLIRREKSFFPWRWQLLRSKVWWMTYSATSSSCGSPDGRKRSGVGILRPRASWTGAESLQNFKNQWNITGTLTICAAWKYAASTTSRSLTIVQVQAGRFFAQFMPWLNPIQLSWIRWTLRSHFFAIVMLLITTHHTTRSSHQNACSGSIMLETRKWLTSLALINYFVCYYCPKFLLIKNVQPKNNIKNNQGILPQKKITPYDINY